LASEAFSSEVVISATGRNMLIFSAPNPAAKVVLFGVLFISFRTFVGSFSGIYPLSEGISVFELGLIKTYLAACILVFDIPSSFLFDRKGYLVSIMIACFSAVIYFFLLSISEEFWQFLAAETFNAIVLALFSGAFTAALHSICSVSGLLFSVENAKYQKWNHLGMLITAGMGSAGVYFLTGGESELRNFAPIFLFSSFAFLFLLISSPLLLSSVRNQDLDRRSRVGDSLEKFKFNVLVSEVIAGANGVKFLFLSLTLNGIIFGVILQLWQPLLFTMDAMMPSLQLFAIFAFTMVAQAMSGSLINNVIVVKITIGLVMLDSMLMLMLMLMSDGSHNNLLLIAFVGSLPLVFFLIRFFNIWFETLLLENLESELKATVISLSGTIDTGLTLILLPLFFFMIGHFGLYSYALVTLILAVIYTLLWQSLRKLKTTSEP